MINQIKWGVIDSGGIARRRTIPEGIILAKGTIGQGPGGEMIAYLEGDSEGYDAQQARDEGKGLRSQKVLAACYHSAKKGKVVDI